MALSHEGQDDRLERDKGGYGFASGSHKNEQSMETSLSSETYQLRERTPHMASTTVATVSSPQEEAETRITALEDASTTDDPQNWSALKKLCHIVPVASLVLAVTLGTSSISPAADQIAEEFEVSREAAILPFALFTFGVGFGPAFAAPLSETYGRSAVYKSTAVVYFLFVLGSALTPTFAGLLICRLLAGMAGGPCIPITGGTTADLFPQHLRADCLATLQMAGFLGSGLGPVIGGFCAYYKGWRWTQWATLMFAGLSLVLLAPMQETYLKIIQQHQNKKRGIRSQSIQTPGDARRAFAKHIITVVLIRPLHMLFTEPIVTAFAVYNSFALGTLYGFFSAYPVVLKKVYGFNEWQTGLTFLSTCVGVLLGWLSAVVIQHQFYLKKWRMGESSDLPPEQRLYLAMLASFGIPIGLFWFAWTARRSIHWIVPTLAGVPFAWGNLSIFIVAVLYLIDCYGATYGASAMAANGIARYSVSAAIPLFSTQMFDGLGTAWAASLLGFFGLALLPIPWIFFKFGPQIRARSRYDKDQG